MPKIQVRNFAVSLDGFGSGLCQDLDNPIGLGGQELMKWFFPTQVWRKINGMDGGETGIDNTFAQQGFEEVGAWILGRNMFGPIRGPWPDETWKGWWGKDPPFHTPVFVLTNYPRPPLQMEGDTEFFFVNDGIHSALEQAKRAAKGRDIRVGGGVGIIRQYLLERLIDEVHLVLRPVLLGSGESLWRGLDLPSLGYECIESVKGERGTHIFLKRTFSLS